MSFLTGDKNGIGLLLELALILTVCRVVGSVSRRLGQPRVVGEIVGGILVGPSLLGAYWPGAQSFLFPQASLGIIQAFSHFGLMLFMFATGLEFRPDEARRQFRTAASVSIAGMAAPLLLGGLIGLGLARDPAFFGASVSRWSGVFFVGVAMSVTAFPVMARMIEERGLTGTRFGTIALAAASVDDACAWCLLAAVMATAGGNPNAVIVAVGGVVLYTAVAFLVGKPLLRRLCDMAERAGGVGATQFSFAMILLLLACWFTTSVGIHEVFGAFILGIVMPRGIFARDVRRALEPLAINVFLPLFFFVSGLNTQISLIAGGSLWFWTVLIFLAACLGKGLACWLAARMNGEDQRSAVAIGALMNSRGLMELVLLNVGLEHGIITGTLFTMMVLMTVVTTLMAGPILDLVGITKASRSLGPAADASSDAAAS